MKKVSRKIIFILTTCATIISVASLNKASNAQEINRNELTPYTTNMESINDETTIRAQSADTTTDIGSWDVSENQDASVTATLTSDGTLTITGTGRMKDYQDYPRYKEQVDNIKKVEIEEGVTNIGDHAFINFIYLTSITIPDSVTTIGDSAFSGNDKLTSITIPNSVTSIGRSAFSCSGLTSIEIPEGVTHISEGVFQKCDSLTSVTIPNSVTTIGDMAFWGNDKLTSITIPNSVTSIGSSAVSMCHNLESITISNSVTTIGDMAFWGNDKLTSITIPNSVTSIGEGVFSYCVNLQNIKVETENLNYCDENGVLFNKDKTKLIKYPEGNQSTEYTIPNSVTSIGNYAFSCSSNLISITIPNSVTTIEGIKNGTIDTEPFYNHNEHLIINTTCDSTYVINYADSQSIPVNVTHKFKVSKIEASTSGTGSTVTYECTNCGETKTEENANVWDVSKNGDNSVIATLTDDGTLAITGNGLMRDYYHNTPYKEQLNNIKKVEIEEGVTGIGEFAFDGCNSLTSVTIPDTVTSIGGSAFNNCSSLISISIPEGVTSIEAALLQNCTNLRTIEFKGNNVTSIGEAAFNNCNSLESITIPEGVTTIEQNALSNCQNLKHITLPSTVKTIRWVQFLSCNNLQEIRVDKNNPYYCDEDGILFNKNKTELLKYPAGKTDLQYTIPDNVTNIIMYSFFNCTNLEKITIPDTVTSIGEDAFRNVADQLVIRCSCNNDCVIEYFEASRLEFIHDWKEPIDYTWNADKTECTAERVCTRDASHKETETVKTTNSVTKEATCEEKGERTYTAIFTNEAFAEQTITEEIPATGHTPGQAVEENRVEATCTEEGSYEEVIYCTVCHAEISRTQKTIAKKEHTYSEEWTIDKEATCEETGEKSHHCTVCGDKKDITEIEATGHDYQIKSTTDAVCEKGGTIIYECTRCKTTKEETIPAKGHTEVIDEAVEATCTTAGKTEGKHCSVCNKVLEAQKEIPALGHDFGTPTYKWNEDKTECTAERKCNRNEEHKETETVKTTNSVTKEATCEEEGERTYTATFSNEAFAEQTATEEIPATGHKWGEWTTTKEPTFTEEGTKTRTCANDETHKETERIAKLEAEKLLTKHEAKEATCEEAGNSEYYSYNNGESEKYYSDAEGTHEIAKDSWVIAATGHTPGQPVEENRVEATCTENGSYDEVTYCKVCGEKLLKETKTIPALGHDYEEIVIQPTETEQGYTLHKCKRCQDEYKDNFVPAIDKKDPIQIKDNEKDITIIEKEEQKYIIVEPNTSVETLKEAIIIEKEYTVIEKENKQKEGILATGDKITVKDTYKTSYIIIVKGDVNGDGVIDFMGDVVLLNNYRLGLIQLSKEAILAGDMNMDGKIDFVEDIAKINNYRISTVRSLIK